MERKVIDLVEKVYGKPIESKGKKYTIAYGRLNGEVISGIREGHFVPTAIVVEMVDGKVYNNVLT